MRPDALGSFPFLVVLGFGLVWITLSTLGLLWFMTWRATRREMALTAASDAKPTPSGLTRRRVFGLLALGTLGGVLAGGAASAYAIYQANQRQPPRGGGTVPPAP